MKALIIVGVIALAISGTLASSASAYDHSPITVYGLYADGWGATTSNAAYNLRYRYHGILPGVYCTGAVIAGDASSSSWIDSNPPQRFWDKLVCAGYTRSGHVFSLVYDTKSANSWIVYRLHGITSYGLVYG